MQITKTLVVADPGRGTRSLRGRADAKHRAAAGRRARRERFVGNRQLDRVREAWRACARERASFLDPIKAPAPSAKTRRVFPRHREPALPGSVCRRRRPR